MRIIKFTKTFQKLNVGKKTNEIKPLEEVRQKKLNNDLMLMVVTMFAILFITTGISLFMQNSTEDSTSEDMDFIDSFYFVLTSGYVIGYGDILYLNATLRIILAMIIIVMILITSNQISKIVSSIRESDKYDIKYNLKNHTIVFSNKSIEIITSFVLHYISYNPDDKILIVDDISMEAKMKKFIEFDFFEGKVYYLSTRTGINTKIITKSSAKKAKRIYFISSPFLNDLDGQDKKASFEKAFLRNRGIS